MKPIYAYEIVFGSRSNCDTTITVCSLSPALPRGRMWSTIDAPLRGAWTQSSAGSCSL